MLKEVLFFETVISACAELSFAKIIGTHHKNARNTFHTEMPIRKPDILYYEMLICTFYTRINKQNILAPLKQNKVAI